MSSKELPGVTTSDVAAPDALHAGLVLVASVAVPWHRL
jgi:hypothetical protein